MRVRSFPFLVACAALSLCGQSFAANPSSRSTTAQRDSSPTLVLGFAAGDHFEQAEALTRAIKRVVEHSTNQRLGSGDYSLEVLTAALGCPEKPDPGCLRKISNKTSSQRMLWGTTEITGQRVDAELHLFTEDGTDKKAKFSYQTSMVDSMDGDLLAVAANAVSQLLGPLHYRVVVRSNEQTGTLWVDDVAVGQLVDGELKLELPNGDHRFRLKTKSGEGTVIAEQSARVQIGEPTKVRLDSSKTEASPVDKKRPSPPATAAPETKAPAERPAEPFLAEEPKPSNTQRTWGYVTMGVGGVFLAGGAAAAIGIYMTNQKDNFRRYRDGLSPSEDACTVADSGREIAGTMPAKDVRSLCRQASMLEIAEIALFAGGAVAVGTGLTLVLTSKSGTAKATTTIEPRFVVGRGRTDLGVVVRF